MYISLKDLAFFIIFCLIVTAGVFMIMMMIHLIKLIKRAQQVLESNQENFTRTMSKMPEVVDNVNELALDIKGNVNKAGLALGSFEDSLSESASTVGEKAESIIAAVRIISGLVKHIVDLFTTSSDKER